jgi:N-acetylglutamate synthase-like GNAT family acetyltransferase
MTQHIEIDEIFGTASGYVVESSREQVGHYLAEHTEQNLRVAEWVKANCHQVALLKNLNVEEDMRGMGHGNDLLEQFIAEAEDFGADAILLIADSGEIQAEGFDLTSWYEGFEFVQVLATTGGPIMVYPREIGERMKASFE